MVNSQARNKIDRQKKVAELRLAGFTSQRAIAGCLIAGSIGRRSRPG